MLRPIGYLALLCGVFITLLIALSIVGLRNDAALSSSTSAGTTPVVEASTIALSEWVVRVSTQVKPGTYTYTITNSGQGAHELLVFRSDLAVADYPTTDGDITEDGPGITKISDGDNLAPGSHNSAPSISVSPASTCLSATYQGTSGRACARW